MKKVIVILFLISISQFINAQEVDLDNKYFIGGSVNFSIQNNFSPITSLPAIFPNEVSSSSNNDFKRTILYFSPYIGKELNPKLYIGANIGYTIAHLTTNLTSIGSPPSDEFKINSNEIEFGLFFRQLINPSNSLKFYIQPYFDYNILNEKTYVGSDYTEEIDVKYYEVGARIGLMYYVSKNFRAIMQTRLFSYTGGSWKNSIDNKSQSFNSFNTYLNLSSFGLGFEYRW